MHVTLSAAVSVDGYLDDASDVRLILSNDADLDLVDDLRAASDAILVGATTVRRDDPRLLVRDAGRRAVRVAAGRPASPLRAVLTRSGDLDPARKVFAEPGAATVVYCPPAAGPALAARLEGRASVVPAAGLDAVLADLELRGVGRLLVEGGSSVHTQFLVGGLADELRLAVAPFFVGDARAPRLVRPGGFPHGPDRRMQLSDVGSVGDVAVLTYRLERDRRV